MKLLKHYYLNLFQIYLSENYRNLSTFKTSIFLFNQKPEKKNENCILETLCCLVTLVNTFQWKTNKRKKTSVYAINFVYIYYFWKCKWQLVFYMNYYIKIMKFIFKFHGKLAIKVYHIKLGLSFWYIFRFYTHLKNLYFKID